MSKAKISAVMALAVWATFICIIADAWKLDASIALGIYSLGLIVIFIGVAGSIDFGDW